MIKVSDIVLCLLNEMPSPESAFQLLLAYCRKSGKNIWEEFGYMFSATATTVLIFHRVENRLFPVGFINTQYEPVQDVYFVNQGYLRKPVDDPSLLNENIYRKVLSIWKMGDKDMVLHSDLPARLWERFGFKESKVKIYRKHIDREKKGEL